MKQLITQQELDQEIATWLQTHPEHPHREEVEKAQMSMASPGQWEPTRVVEVSDNSSDTPSDGVSSNP